MKTSEWAETALVVCAVLVTLGIAISQPINTLNAIIIAFNVTVGGSLIASAVRKWRRRHNKERSSQQQAS